VPLSALFFLERGDEDGVTALGAGEAAVGVTRSAEQVMRVVWEGMPPVQRRRVTTQALENAIALVKEVPAFRLRFTLGGRFWEHVERALEGAGRQVSCPGV